MVYNIAVVGAGVTGLSTAYLLLKRANTVPGLALKLSVIAEHFTNDTTSCGAAGIFLPSPISSGIPPEKVKEWAKRGSEHFWKLARSPEAVNAGVSFTAGYTLSPAEVHVDSVRAYGGNAERISPSKCLATPIASRYEHACRFETLMTEGRRYLPYLMSKISEMGGEFIQKKVQSPTELDDYDIVVYCCGAGAKELLNDDKIKPSRGYTMRVKAPWIRTFLFISNVPKWKSLYIFPGMDNVVVGGYYQPGDFETKVRISERDDLWKRAIEACPSLANARIEYEWVGFRPQREGYRLSKEKLFNQRKQCFTTVVYNYGFGSNGMSLSYGAASEAVDLVMEDLMNSPTSSKL